MSLRRNWKVEKLKNEIHMENLLLNIPGKTLSIIQLCVRNYSGTFPETVFSREIQGEILHKKTVFQFFSFAYGTIPEHFWRQNWKTEKLFFPERSRERFSKNNSFSVFPFCLRNYSGTFPETKLKNWKTVFSWRISPWISLEKNSFSVFQFCLRNSSGTFPETKLKNWKTVFLWRISPWISLEKTVFQFFSFAYGTLPEHFRRQN